MSTPNFINDLTDISVKILSSENKEKFLSGNLQKINKSLPAATYVPILSNFQRNYMVLNVAHQESRLFITAEKAPFLICVEVFQPQELELYIQQMHAQEKPRAYEILNKLNLINKDQNKLVQKINYELSRPQYVGSARNDAQIKADRKQADLKKKLNESGGALCQSEMQMEQQLNSGQFGEDKSGGLLAVGSGIQKFPSYDEYHDGRNAFALQGKAEERKPATYQAYMNAAQAQEEKVENREDNQHHDNIGETSLHQSSDFGTAHGYNPSVNNYDSCQMIQDPMGERPAQAALLQS